MEISTRPFAFVVLALLLVGACKEDIKNDDKGSAPPPTTSNGPARANTCAGGGGTVKDSVSESFFPRTAGGYCIDPASDTKTYGDKGKFSMDEVCTTAFDGECEVYKRFGLTRVVALRYVDGAGSAGTVEVNLSTFSSPGGAYGMFTKRVVADDDPIRASVKPLAAGGAGAIGKSNAYVWKGPYLAELTFVTEDTKATAEQIAKWSQDATSAIAKEIGSKLPGSADPLPAVKALPNDKMVTLGVSYQPKDVPGIAALTGGAAIGYYADGDKRWRVIAVVRDDADQAKDVMKGIATSPGAMPIKDVGDQAAQIVVQEGGGSSAGNPYAAKGAPSGGGGPKVDYVFARRGATLLGIGDEELVLKPSDPADKQAQLKLTKDEKLAKLRALLK